MVIGFTPNVGTNNQSQTFARTHPLSTYSDMPLTAISTAPPMTARNFISASSYRNHPNALPPAHVSCTAHAQRHRDMIHSIPIGAVRTIHCLARPTVPCSATTGIASHHPLALCLGPVVPLVNLYQRWLSRHSLSCPASNPAIACICG